MKELFSSFALIWDLFQQSNLYFVYHSSQGHIAFKSKIKITKISLGTVVENVFVCVLCGSVLAARTTIDETMKLLINILDYAAGKKQIG